MRPAYNNAGYYRSSWRIEVTDNTLLLQNSISKRVIYETGKVGFNDKDIGTGTQTYQGIIDELTASMLKLNGFSYTDIQLCKNTLDNFIADKIRLHENTAKYM